MPGTSVLSVSGLLTQQCKGFKGPCKGSEGLSSEPAYPHFHHIVLAKVSPKASSDPRDEKTDATHQREELHNHNAKDVDAGKNGELEHLCCQSTIHTNGWTHNMLLLLFSFQIMSDSLRPHRVQHFRLLCPSLSP